MGVDILLDWPLTPQSLVIDVGGYTGVWLSALQKHLGFMPLALLYEPVPRFADSLEKKFQGNQRVIIFRYGLSDKTERVTFSIEGDRSGVYHDAPEQETVQLMDVASALAGLSIDLIQFNCEGGEYTILPRMIESGIISNCRALQIQFHRDVPDYEAKRDAIREKLALTHEEKFCTPFIWEAWVRK